MPSDLIKTPEWHARRARNIGSSEIAALFGRTDAELKLHERDLSPRPAADVTFTEVLIGLAVLVALGWVLS